MKYILVIFVAFTSCNNSNIQKTESDTTIIQQKNEALIRVNPSDRDALQYRQCIDFSFKETDIESNDFISILLKSFPVDFEGVKPVDVKSIRRVKKQFNISQFGICDILEIKLSEELATVIPKRLSLFINTSLSKAVLFPFEYLQPVKIKPEDSSILIGGAYINNAKGYFVIYQFDNANRFTLIFESASDRYCGNGVPVFNNSIDCVSYSPFMLTFKNNDIDGDGFNDLQFHGKALIFCEGLETGYGREDRKPLKEQSLNIMFKTVVTNGTINWELVDTSICKLLSVH